MLPDDFEWRPGLGGEGLYFGARRLATLTALDEGQCRVSTRPDQLGQQYAFFATYGTGRRYVEAWARKWENRLREEGNAPWTLYAGDTMRPPTPGTVQTTHHRRARRRY